MTQRFFFPTRSNSTFDELSTEPRQTPISACLFLWPPLRLPPRRMAHTRTLQSMAHPDGWWPAGAVLPCAAQPRSVCRPGVRARACGRRLARVPGRPVDVPIIPGGPGRDSCRTRPTCSSYACLKLLRPVIWDWVGGWPIITQTGARFYAHSGTPRMPRKFPAHEQLQVRHRLFWNSQPYDPITRSLDHKQFPVPPSVLILVRQEISNVIPVLRLALQILCVYAVTSMSHGSLLLWESTKSPRSTQQLGHTDHPRRPAASSSGNWQGRKVWTAWLATADGPCLAPCLFPLLAVVNYKI